jgi:Fe-S cluster assembly iron-binding protein IscA
VLLLSETAVAEIARQCALAGHDATARVRSLNATDPPSVRLELGVQPRPHDIVVSRDGVTVSVDNQFSTIARDATLDVTTDPSPEDQPGGSSGQTSPVFVLLSYPADGSADKRAKP